MSIQFSDVAGNTGILQRTRKMMRVDATQWPTVNVVNSCNDWADNITGYALATDKRFQWDDTNHTKLPEGTTSLNINQTDYSFLTDEQGNAIVTLIGVSLVDSSGNETALKLVDRNDTDYNVADFGKNSGTPSRYDKIADNIIRLDTKPSATIAGGLKFYFQRTSSYFTVGDATKSPGVSPLLHRGFVIASAYDGALTLGLSNLQSLGVEMQREQQKMEKYFSDRNKDMRSGMKPKITSSR